MTTRSISRWALALLLTLLSAVLFIASAAAADSQTETGDEVWYTVSGDEVTVDLYFYWSPTCPHCQEARPFIEALPVDYPWIDLHSHDISKMTDSEIEFAQELQVQVGESIQGVPAFFYCGVLQTGFGDAETTGVFLVEQLSSCRDALLVSLEPEIEDPVERLRASHRAAVAMKAHMKATVEAGADLSSLMQVCPPLIMGAVHWHIKRQQGGLGFFGNLILSNVPGPREPIYFNTYKLDSWFSTGQVFDGSCINITMWSYCEHANLCILADANVIEDGWVPFAYFVEELDQLCDLIPASTPEQQPML